MSMYFELIQLSVAVMYTISLFQLVKVTGSIPAHTGFTHSLQLPRYYTAFHLDPFYILIHYSPISFDPII